MDADLTDPVQLVEAVQTFFAYCPEPYLSNGKKPSPNSGIESRR